MWTIQSTYSRRTFDRRLSTISPGDIKNRITAMGELFFICDKIVDPYILFQQTQYSYPYQG
jgi:hypothetical protein